jgi:ribosomal protein S11
VRVKGFFSPQELVAAIDNYASNQGVEVKQVKAVNNGDGSVSVTSSSQQEMIACMKNLAANNKAFIATDPKTNQVIAYSDGDGVLKKPDGTEYTANIIERSSVYKQDFNVLI